MNVGDRVSYKGRLGIICRDRMNGMIDIAYDYEGKPPQVGSGEYWCGGTETCVYQDELRLLSPETEEICSECGCEIKKGEGRFRMAEMKNTRCEACGEKFFEIKSGVIL